MQKGGAYGLGPSRVPFWFSNYVVFCCASYCKLIILKKSGNYFWQYFCSDRCALSRKMRSLCQGAAVSRSETNAVGSQPHSHLKSWWISQWWICLQHCLAMLEIFSFHALFSPATASARINGPSRWAILNRPSLSGNWTMDWTLHSLLGN